MRALKVYAKLINAFYRKHIALEIIIIKNDFMNNNLKTMHVQKKKRRKKKVTFVFSHSVYELHKYTLLLTPPNEKGGG